MERHVCVTAVVAVDRYAVDLASDDRERDVAGEKRSGVVVGGEFGQSVDRVPLVDAEGRVEGRTMGVYA